MPLARKNRRAETYNDGMKQSVPKSVDEYIAAQPEAMRPKLEQVRAAIRKAVPEAVEGIGYRMPGYKLHGKPMLYFAGFKEHYSLFAASGTFFAALEDELRGYELRKGTVHFPLTKPVPVKLISRIAKLRAAGIAATAKKTGAGPRKRKTQVSIVGDSVASHRARPRLYLWGVCPAPGVSPRLFEYSNKCARGARAYGASAPPKVSDIGS